jgi:tetratricopeptide (TPR) repeat protein
MKTMPLSHPARNLNPNRNPAFVGRTQNQSSFAIFALFRGGSVPFSASSVFSCLALLLVLAFAPLPAGAADAIDYADALSKAKLFQQPLSWVGTLAPDPDESRALYEAAGLDPAQKPADLVGSLEGFIQSHPNSPWTPSLLANLARYYRSQGRYSLALDHWQKAWQLTKDATDPRTRLVADFTLAYWSDLLSSLGRVDELQQLLDAAQGRHSDNAEFQHQFELARQTTAVMRHRPGIAFRCGSMALYNVARALNAKSDYSKLLNMSSPGTGFSVARLQELSDEYGLGLVAVKRPSGNQLVMPSVVHWNEDHYAAIVAKQNGAYKVIDPTFGKPQWLLATTINENASGVFLVPSDAVPKGWQPLTKEEAQNTFGKGYFGNSVNGKPSGPPCPSGDPAQGCVECYPPPPPYALT